MHGIKVLMAKNYIDNLSEEVKKGHREKTEEGGWPTFAPIGYVNALGVDGKRALVVDEERAQQSLLASSSGVPAEVSL
jgi:hypothetical protein